MSHFPPPYLIPARTIKEISGARIETIPIGTEFEITYFVLDYGYVNCHGLHISSVWLDELEIIG